ncbi:MAG: hypothetical protein ACRDV9_00630 [Acidimicrobiia bacterium]
MRRSLLATLAVGALVLGFWAKPASAHATFDGPSSYPSDTDQRLTLNVPEERGQDTHNSKVKVFVRAGWRPLGCEATTPWSCEAVSNAGGGNNFVEWAKDQNASPGASDETFIFMVHTGPPGKVSFPVIQTYSNPSEEVHWIGEPNDEEPAPVLDAAVVAASTTTSQASTTTRLTTTPTTTLSTTVTTQAPSSSTSTAASSTSTTAPAAEGGASSAPTTEGSTTSTSSEGEAAAPRASGGSRLPLVLAGLVLLGSGALVALRRKRPGGR